MLSDLGSALLARIECTRQLADITEACAILQRAVDLASPSDLNLGGRLTNLGISYQHRFECMGNLSDVAEAISAYQRAVELTSTGHGNLPGCLTNLGNSYRSRFELLGDLSDIAEAISAHQRAAELTPTEHPNLPGRFNNLGNTYQSRFDYTGNLSDIAEAISAHLRAVELTPTGHPSLPGCFNNLGNSYQSRYNCMGDLSDITEAISAHQKAVELTPAGDPNLSGCFSNLGNTYQSRFDHIGDLSDIAEAISAHLRAVELTPTGHPRLPGHWNNLGRSYRSCFDRTGNLSDIAEAISAYQKAVELTPPGHGNLPDLLNNLGSSYQSRFNRMGNLPDISEAISAIKKAVELTPTGNTKLPDLFNNLGNLYLSRFACMSDLSDIAEAILAQQKAVELTPARHPYLSVRHYNLASSFKLSSLMQGNHSNLDKSLFHYKSAASFDFAAPSLRLRGAKQWAQLMFKHYPQSPETIIAFETVMSLLQLVAGQEHTIQHQHLQLQDTSDLPLQAAAAACSLGHIDKALEWLEQGRCLVWTQLNHLRTPIDDLLAHHNPDLAHCFLDVSKRLECAAAQNSPLQSGMSLSDKISLEKKAHTQLTLATEWDDLLHTIRTTLPGFHNFLQPSSCSTLIHNLPDSGPIVVVNVHHSRCDAIAVLAGLDEPLHIPLPKLSLEKAKAYHQDFMAHLQQHQVHMQAARVGPLDNLQERGLQPFQKIKKVHNVLAGLWRNIVKPILEALAFLVSECYLTCNHSLITLIEV
jgi:tetratricopeptide (TPR) repeat protein